MQPNKYQINTKYATLKNDAKGVVSITIPNSFTINAGSATLASEIELGEKSAGMHFVFTSTKYPDIGLVSSQVLIPCQTTYDSTNGRVTINNLLNCYVYRSAPRKVRMEITPNIPGNMAGTTMQITGAGQTISCHVSTLISPFEA